ncbi:hypothetical protein B5V89_17245 [Heyndrickxia sporothermodurans]|uniref:hypothetical protein n=1 Tax=Heyndrickxia sporothermodurans TaxID=46224 RepID=UPI000D3B4879|nr:hypothetical protein [Heyndrickxia sporothermodurans]PTY76622.1 hypothetical protein B5V89_17245 [Heyndrickxia sporothermodurans]
MNLFEIDIQSVFDMASQTILVNDTERQAIVTTPPLTENEERFIHTLDIVHMGDLVTLDDEKYLSLTESITKRHSKYKAKIRHCNYVIEMPGEVIEDFMRDENGELILDRYGDPIPITIVGDPIFIPSIVENKTFSIAGSQLLVAENQIIVIAQDNEVNRGKFTVNNTFSLMDLNWKVRNQDRTKKGLLILTCERV